MLNGKTRAIAHRVCRSKSSLFTIGQWKRHPLVKIRDVKEEYQEGNEYESTLNHSPDMQREIERDVVQIVKQSYVVFNVSPRSPVTGFAGKPTKAT